MVNNASISDSTSGSDIASDVGVVNGQQAHMFTQAQCQQILNLLNNEHIVEVVASLASMVGVSNNWIMDTRATDHMLFTFQCLEFLLACVLDFPYVQIPNGSSTSITHIGTCTIHLNFQLIKDLSSGRLWGGLVGNKAVFTSCNLLDKLMWL
ncbi:hypothetical protein PVK06_044613 [Gossypium arboreum]|uniref:Uncharacterized protein n=1 Tax=Gossypium arboreum TaxID=29729 RepID=A0ABR0MRN6_GOSAR|nr:hypothetical protein PVK06_044613 [Gossypium arboreum]